MTGEEKLDAIIRKLDDSDRRFSEYRKEIRAELGTHGRFLARLDERSVQHEKHMSWIQKKAGGFGALAGTIVSVFLNWLC